ncbi:MAG: AI-2E family transporter [Anaerolineae bacterium]|nr:MAG: AI-2E family transporter [Anaerolineae bacterium]
MIEDEGQKDSEANLDTSSQTYSVSPHWRNSTKRLVVTILVVLALLLLYRVRVLIIPLIMTTVLAYIVLPAVDFLHERTKLSRNGSIAIIYLLIATILIAIPASTIPQLIAQGNSLIANTPRYISQIGIFLSEPFTMGDISLPIDELPLEDVYGSLSNNLLDIVRAVGPQGFSLFGTVATATLSTVAWILIVFVLSIYLVKDYSVLWDSIVALAPATYQFELQRLGSETRVIWNSFLRGQLILGFIIGVSTTLSLLLVGLPNAFLLGLLAGVLEFIPNIGPIIAAIPAVLIAIFQSEESWLGSIVSPFWFALIILAIYAVIQRVENMYLVPRIIGRSLNLHPLVVLVGALAGASIAGIFGILLAAPLLATAKLLLMYIYRKLLDKPPFDDKLEE